MLSEGVSGLTGFQRQLHAWQWNQGKIFKGEPAAEVFLFKYKEMHTYDHYAPFILLVFPHKTTFTFLPISLSLDIVSGSLKTVWKFSLCSEQGPGWSFSKIIHVAESTWVLHLTFAVGCTSSAIGKARVILNDSLRETPRYPSFHYHITSTEEVDQLWRYLFTHVPSV